MSKNGNLHAAKRAKNDEFYTRRTDIEKEMVHYRKQFVGKTIFCNCDDPDWSNFWKYFYDNFDYLMLEGLISTHYETEGSSYKLEVYKDPETGLRGKVVKTPLIGNGDFRSDECVELLKQVDIVITNPPFSLFREYIAQLIEYDKKFIVIGNKNAVTYKEIFPLIRDNKMWIGGRSMNADFWLRVPEGQPFEKMIDNEPVKHIMGCWFTNMDLKKRHDELFLYRHYHGKDHDMYPKYDNYDAIEVSKVVDIPCDYDGVMGVPITFLDKYNPDQFEIIGHEHDLMGDGGSGIKEGQFIINGKGVYKRILIRRKH